MKTCSKDLVHFEQILEKMGGEVRTKLYRKYMRLTSLTSLMSLMSQKEEFFLLGILKRKNSSFGIPEAEAEEGNIA